MEEKNCKNCGNYIPHYVKSSNMRLAEIEGHCVYYLHKRGSLSSKLRANCEHWTPQENKKEKRRKSAIEILRDMEKTLSDISLILKSDED